MFSLFYSLDNFFLRSKCKVRNSVKSNFFYDPTQTLGSLSWGNSFFPLLKMISCWSLTVLKPSDSISSNKKKKREITFRHHCSPFARYLKHPFSNFFLLLPLLSSASFKAGVPSEGELEYLSLELGDQWEQLGRRLGFNQAAITRFDSSHKGLNKKAFKMLIAWRRKEGAGATYKVLYDALCDKRVQCKELAQQFCCKWACKNGLSLVLYFKRLSHFYITLYVCLSTTQSINELPHYVGNSFPLSLKI